MISIQDCFVAGNSYKHIAQSPVSLDQLQQYPLILLEKGSRTRAFLDEIALKQGLTIKPEIELGSVDLLVEFAESGLGIACVTKEFVVDELNRGSLYEIPLLNPLPPRHIGVIKRKRTPLSVAASHLHEMLLHN